MIGSSFEGFELNGFERRNFDFFSFMFSLLADGIVGRKWYKFTVMTILSAGLQQRSLQGSQDDMFRIKGSLGWLRQLLLRTWAHPTRQVVKPELLEQG